MVETMNEHLEGLARTNALGAVLVLVIRAIVVALGLLLMAISVPIGLVTPFIPIGTIIGFVGLVMVAAASKTLHRFITNVLRRWPWLWSKVRWAFGEKDETGSETDAKALGKPQLTNERPTSNRPAE